MFHHKSNKCSSAGRERQKSDAKIKKPEEELTDKTANNGKTLNKKSHAIRKRDLPGKSNTRKSVEPERGRGRDFPSVKKMARTGTSEATKDSAVQKKYKDNTGEKPKVEGLMLSVPLKSSFKIPKRKNSSPGLVLPAPTMAPPAAVVPIKIPETKRENIEKRSFVPIALSQISIPKDVNEDFEEMEWETTIQEILELCQGAQIFQSTVDPSQIMDVDVDMEVESSLPSSLNEKHQLIIVPDTNIWLHDLRLIQEVMNAEVVGFDEKPVILVPWMVLQELDYHGKTPQSTSRPAIRFIHTYLVGNHPQLKGQRAADAVSENSTFEKLMADDSILQCALQCQSQNSVAVLLTNDLNLENKALVNNLVTANGKNCIEKIKSLKEKKCQYYQTLPNTPVSHQSALPHSVKKPDRIFNGSNQEPKQSFKRAHSSNLDNQFKKTKEAFRPAINSGPREPRDLLELIRTTFSHIIQVKMKEDYGEPGWLDALKVSPPWTAKSAIDCVLKHWIAVFSEVFGRSKSLAEKLLPLVTVLQHTTPIETEKEQEAIEYLLGMFASGELAMSDLIRRDSVVATSRQKLLTWRTKQ